jgi:hypothetical protein
MDLLIYILAIANDNIPLKSVLSSPSANRDLKRKINSRSTPEHSPTIQTTTDTRLYSNADSQLLRSQDAGIVRFILF